MLSVVALAACSSSSNERTPAESTRVSELPIQAGTATPAYSYSVALCRGPSATECVYRCSGTLIAPNLVVTVRHCFYRAPQTQVDCAVDTFDDSPIAPPGEYWVTTNAVLGGNFSSGWHRGARFVAPGPRSVCGADIAALVLTDNVAPSEAVPAEPAIGAPLTDHARFSTTVAQIGYGETGPSLNDFGTRRLRQGVAMSCLPGDPSLDCAPYARTYSDREFVLEGGGCEGDSGSGAFDQRPFNEAPSRSVLLGVLARSDPASCTPGYYTRLDVWGSWVAGAGALAAKLGGYVAPPWTASAAADASVEPPANNYAPRSLGAACTANSDCDSNECASDDGGFTFACTRGCNAHQVGACPTGFSCLVFASGEQRCFSDHQAPTAQPPEDPGGCALARTGSDATRRGRPLGSVCVALLLGALLLHRGRRARG